MDRTDNQYPNLTIKVLKDAADRLAFELLAPSDTVVDHIVNYDGSHPQTITDILVDHYGLPSSLGRTVCRTLCSTGASSRPFARLLTGAALSGRTFSGFSGIRGKD